MTPKALIIDDSQTSQAILKKLLQQHSYEVDCSDTGETGLQFLQQNSVDVVFLDHTLPGKNGLEVLDILKSQAATRQTPIVMYTAQDTEEYKQNALRKGAAAVLNKNIKDINVSNILSVVNPHIVGQKKPESREPAAATDAVETPSETKTETAAAAVKPVSALADTPAAQKPRRNQSEEAIDSIFSRAKYDHLTHKMQAMQLQQQNSRRWYNAALLLLALPLIWLLIETMAGPASPVIVNTGDGSGSVRVEQQLAKQQQLIEELTQEINTQRQMFAEIQSQQSQLSTRQEDIQTRLSQTSDHVEDLRYNVSNASNTPSSFDSNEDSNTQDGSGAPPQTVRDPLNSGELGGSYNVQNQDFQ